MTPSRTPWRGPPVLRVRNAVLLLASCSSTRVRSVLVYPGVTRITVFAFVTERGCARCANVLNCTLTVTHMNCLLWEIHCRLSMTDAVHMPPSHSGLRVGHPPLTWFYRPHCRFRSHRGCHPRNPAPSGPVSAEHGPAARGRVDGRGGADAPSPAPCAPPVPHPARFPTPPKKVARG